MTYSDIPNELEAIAAAHTAEERSNAVEAFLTRQEKLLDRIAFRYRIRPGIEWERDREAIVDLVRATARKMLDDIGSEKEVDPVTWVEMLAVRSANAIRSWSARSA